MALIRIFRTRDEAQRAKEILKEGSIESNILEDKFNNVPIQQFGVPARFRLIVDDTDYEKAATFIARKLKRKRLNLK